MLESDQLAHTRRIAVGRPVDPKDGEPCAVTASVSIFGYRRLGSNCYVRGFGKGAESAMGAPVSLAGKSRVFEFRRLFAPILRQWESPDLFLRSKCDQ